MPTTPTKEDPLLQSVTVGPLNMSVPVLLDKYPIPAIIVAGGIAIAVAPFIYSHGVLVILPKFIKEWTSAVKLCSDHAHMGIRNLQHGLQTSSRKSIAYYEQIPFKEYYQKGSQKTLDYYQTGLEYIPRPLKSLDTWIYLGTLSAGVGTVGVAVFFMPPDLVDNFFNVAESRVKWSAKTILDVFTDLAQPRPKIYVRTHVKPVLPASPIEYRSYVSNPRLFATREHMGDFVVTSLSTEGDVCVPTRKPESSKVIKAVRMQ